MDDYGTQYDTDENDTQQYNHYDNEHYTIDNNQSEQDTFYENSKSIEPESVIPGNSNGIEPESVTDKPLRPVRIFTQEERNKLLSITIDLRNKPLQSKPVQTKPHQKPKTKLHQKPKRRKKRS